MTSCQSTKRYKTFRIEEEICRKKVLQEEMRKIREEIDQNEERFRQLSDKVDKNKMDDAEMAAELQGCRQEKEEEAAMLRKRWIVVWRQWWISFSLWERTRRGLSSMRCVKYYSSRDSRPRFLPRRCQEKEEEEGRVKTNKNKGKPVSSWRCQREAGSMKALQRVVWSLIFILFGVHMVKAVEQEVQVQKRSRRQSMEQDDSKIANGNRMRDLFVLNKKKKETARVRKQEPFKNTAKVGTLVPLRQTAKERTREPLKNQKKVAGSEEAEGKEVEQKENEKETD